MNEELKVIITADVSSLKSGLKEATDGINKTGEEAAKHEGKGKKILSSLGDAAKAAGKAIAAGIGAGVTALGALTTKSLEAYGDYEQLAGGVETLFKNSADVVKGYADEAYKTAGLSANQYMETVTSFSASLLQSLDGDTAKAAEAANQAVIDMSDNANKMGTSMESIQNAYQGFAKQNYTMLDNLKLGYGGTEKEMQRLLKDAEELTGKKFNIENFNDITEAIHAIQTEMGITGTTAKEASTTIQGSIGSMKAAWENLVTGLMNPDADLGELVTNMIETATTAIGNIAPKIVELLPNVSSALNDLISKTMEILPSLLQELLPPLIEGATTLIQGLVEAAPQFVSLIIDILPTLISGITDIFTSIVDQLPSLIDTIIDGLITLSPLLIDCGIELFVSLVEAIPEILPKLVDALPKIIDTIVGALLDNLPMILKTALKVFLAIVEAIPKMIPDLINGIGDILDTITKHLVDGAVDLLHFDWSLPKLKLPHLSITGEFSLDPPSIPKFDISWYARGGVFDKPTLFGYGNGSIGGIGEAGAEAIVPLEKNTKWLDIIAEKLGAKNDTPVILEVDGKVFAQTSISTINQLTKQTGKLGLIMR